MLARFAAAAALSLATTTAWAGSGIESLDTVQVATGMSRPVVATYAPGDFTRLFIAEQHTGRIEVLNLKTGVVNSSPFLDISVSTGNEQGLLGVCFHPDYQNNRKFYLNYTNSNGNTVIEERFRSVNNPDQANGTSDTILTINQPFSNHNGGWIGFGPCDGYLYIATGDGGSFCDPAERAQDVDNLLGKILRIDVDGDDFPQDLNKDYAIPNDNPFADGGGAPEVWNWGLRNPWRCSFDRDTCDLWIGDVGQDAREEIDFQPAGSSGGLNYGWDCKEGFSCSSIGPSFCSLGDTCGCSKGALVDPIYDYPHSSGICTVVGGYVYRGCDIPTLNGTYFFADYCTADIWTFEGTNVNNFTDRTNELDPASGSIGFVMSFGEDAKGEMYITDQSGSEVFKIVPTTPTVSEADLNCDGSVNVTDLLALLAAWDDCDGCREDLNGDHVVDISELLALLGEWG
jgi:hypothetical protein